VFEENNDKFTLTPISNTPPLQNPSQNPTPTPSNNSDEKIETKLRYSFLSNEYAFFTSAITPESTFYKETIILYITRKNPFWKGIIWDLVHANDNINKIPNFEISFLKKDASRYQKATSNDNEYTKHVFHFEEDNTKFTLTPLGK
jgi:hypothetical protein